MTYEYEHPEPLCKPEIVTFEIYGVAMEDRHLDQFCPYCDVPCRRIISKVHFNEIFPGSTKQQALAEHYTQMSKEAQEEGFRSKDEIDTAIGLAAERAKQMGKPDKQLIGPVQSPFKNEYTPSAEEVNTVGKVYKEHVKAVQSGDDRKARNTKEALREHETRIKKKVAAGQTFAPKHDKPALQKQIKESREARKQ